MKKEQAIIIGAGPCGLAAAIALQEKGIKPIIIEKGNVVNSLYHYPTHQTFFSTSDRLEIGNVAFITENRKPVRNQALSYYREVVKRKDVHVQPFEKVLEVKKKEQGFEVHTSKGSYSSPIVVMATGYYDQPNMLNVPGEELPHVFHYFKEGHPYFDCDVTVIGGKNSSVDAALELVKAGARVTVLYRGSEYSKSVKPWILPEFDALVQKGIIKMEFNAVVNRITENQIIYTVSGEGQKMKDADFVFAMIGYHPDHCLLQSIGVEVNKENGRPFFNPETMETNIPGLYIAGVIAAGNNANEIFIENGKFHGGLIAEHAAKNLNL